MDNRHSNAEPFMAGLKLITVAFTLEELSHPNPDQHLLTDLTGCGQLSRTAKSTHSASVWSPLHRRFSVTIKYKVMWVCRHSKGAPQIGVPSAESV